MVKPRKLDELQVEKEEVVEVPEKVEDVTSEKVEEATPKKRGRKPKAETVKEKV